MKKATHIILSLIFGVIYLSGCSKNESSQPVIPSILSISSTSFAVGDTINISGTNFSSITSENSVKFNGVSISVIAATATQLTVVIPTGLSSGSVTISVTVKSQTASYIFTFTRLGAVTTLAGSVNSGFVNGAGKDARFYNTNGMAIDGSGNVFVCDINNRVIRKITPDGTVSTFAGNGIQGVVDGFATTSSFAFPSGITIDASGNLYVTETVTNVIRKVTPTGTVTTFAGGGSGIPTDDGTRTNARFTLLTAITIDASGNLFVTDGSCVRKITSGGVVTTFAGDKTAKGSLDATGTAARFSNMNGIACDASGNIFVTDKDNNSIRKITAAGIVTTFAGGAYGHVDGIGTAAKFGFPIGIASDVSGNLYVTSENHTIRKITSGAVVSSIIENAGGYKDGNTRTALVNSPSSIAIDVSGNLYFTETLAHRVRKIIF